MRRCSHPAGSSAAVANLGLIEAYPDDTLYAGAFGLSCDVGGPCSPLLAGVAAVASMELRLDFGVMMVMSLSVSVRSK